MSAIRMPMTHLNVIPSLCYRDSIDTKKALLFIGGYV